MADDDYTQSPKATKFVPKDSLISSMQMDSKCNFRSHNFKEAEKFRTEAIMNPKRSC